MLLVDAAHKFLRQEREQPRVSDIQRVVAVQVEDLVHGQTQFLEVARQLGSIRRFPDLGYGR